MVFVDEATWTDSKRDAEDSAEIIGIRKAHLGSDGGYRLRAGEQHFSCSRQPQPIAIFDGAQSELLLKQRSQMIDAVAHLLGEGSQREVRTRPMLLDQFTVDLHQGRGAKVRLRWLSPDGEQLQQLAAASQSRRRIWSSRALQELLKMQQGRRGGSRGQQPLVTAVMRGTREGDIDLPATETADLVEAEEAPVGLEFTGEGIEIAFSLSKQHQIRRFGLQGLGAIGHLPRGPHMVGDHMLGMDAMIRLVRHQRTAQAAMDRLFDLRQHPCTMPPDQPGGRGKMLLLKISLVRRPTATAIISAWTPEP
jgi:hypothetical protein